MKKCTKCGVRRAENRFPKFKSKNGKYYLKGLCKKCDNKRNYRYKKQGVWYRYNDYKKGAKSRKYKFNLTKEQFKTFWQKPCYYCGDKIETIGLDRVDNEIGYEIENVVPCCSICNKMKLNHTKESFIRRISKIYSEQIK